MHYQLHDRVFPDCIVNMKNTTVSLETEVLACVKTDTVLLDVLDGDHSGLVAYVKVFLVILSLLGWLFQTSWNIINTNNPILSINIKEGT